MSAPHVGARRSLVDSEVAKHTARDGFDASMITVTHTPNGAVTHLVAAEGDIAPVVQYDEHSGRVITKVVTDDYGTILTVLGGPAVVEVALHYTPAQRITYAGAVQAVDQEALSHVMVASRTAVLTILQHLGMTVEDEPVAEPAPAEGDGTELWARLLSEHGPCTCATFDDDNDCTAHCELCRNLPEDWPCPAWSGTAGGYGPGAVAGRP